MTPDHDATHAAFDDAVNMTPAALERWLETDESKAVGWKGADGDDAGAESVGHAMGRRIVTLLRTKKAALGEDDVAAMAKVVGYVHRHSAQRPDGHVTDTRWRYALMNWGHDPLAD